MAAADLDAAAAEHGATADVEILIDDDDGRAVIARTDGGGQPGGAGADHDHIGRMIPADVVGGIAVHCGRHY